MKTRPLGEVLLDLEHLLDEMYLKHDLQVGDVLSLVYSNSTVHYPDSVEEYHDGTNPVFYYGPVDNSPGKK
jgi:hypothetical protein